MVNVIVAGCRGRMGRRIVGLALKAEDIKLTGVFEHKDHPDVGKDISELMGEGRKGIVVASSLAEVVEKGDVVIDLTFPAATLEHVKIALQAGKKMVIGTTGISDKEKGIIEKSAARIPIVFAPNMSMGVNLLLKLTRMVASALSDAYDVEIVEAHHKYKKDAPSGTAYALGRAVAEGRKCVFEENAVYGRVGKGGERRKGAIGIHALRGGDVVGEHTVSFMTEGERLDLTHRASSRDTFAKGALVAAKFVSSKKSGLFTMQDVLGIK